MLTTYPDSNNLSTYAASFSQKADFGRFRSIGLQFDDYTATSRGLTAANWGGENRTIRTATRRLHAGRQLLMLPNPHRCRCGGCRRDRRAWLRCPWAAAGPGRASRQRAKPHVGTASAAGVEGAGGTGGHGRASRRGLAAVPVGGGGAWPGYSQRHGPTGVEGAGGPGGHGRASRRGAERSEAA